MKFLLLLIFLIPTILCASLTWLYPNHRTIFLFFLPAVWLAGMWLLYAPFLESQSPEMISASIIMFFCHMLSMVTVPIGILIWIFPGLFSKKKDGS